MGTGTRERHVAGWGEQQVADDTSKRSHQALVPGLVLRCAALAGLFEGIAVARYQVLQGDPGQLAKAIACVMAFVVVQLVVWGGLAFLVRRRLSMIGMVRVLLAAWAIAVIVGRGMLQDRLSSAVAWPVIAGLLLVALVPRRAWEAGAGWVGELTAYLGVLLVGTSSLLGLVPDESHATGVIVLQLVVTGLLALGLLSASWHRPKLVAAAVLLAMVGSFMVERMRPIPDGPNVLFVMLDTTRRDHVSPFGEKVVATAVSELAAAGVRFDQAVTVVPKTPGSVASFWTGLYPYHHGVRGLYDRLEAKQPTLAEAFRDAGYTTIGLIDNGWLRRGRGFGQGFQRFRGYYELATPYAAWTEFSWWRFVDQLSVRRIPRFNPQTSARRLSDAAVKAITREKDRPFFLYAHYFEPHWPYLPPPKEATRYGGPHDGSTLVNNIESTDLSRGELIFQNSLPEEENEKARRLYRGEVHDTLSQVRRLFAAIDRLGLEEDTIVLFTTDHGHSLGEHGYYFHHGELLNEVSVRIPLVIRWPGHVPAGRVVDTQVRSIDVAPTLLGLAGVPGRWAADGRSLVRLWDDGAANRDFLAYVESDVRMFAENPRRDLSGIVGKLRALRTTSRKVVLNPRKSGPEYELYDLESDPGELVNLADATTHRDELQRLRDQLWSMIPPQERESLLAAFESGGGDADEQSLDRTEIEQLRSLGYIN